MYLPVELLDAHVLITVKTYPLPSNKYEELVCTAGLLSNGKWIRIYPVPFRALPYAKQYKKYEWIGLDLARNTSDFRPESYRPRRGSDETIRMMGEIGTANEWEQRKSYALKEVFTSMSELVLVSPAKWNPLHKPIEPIGDDSFCRFGAQIAPFPFRPIP